MMDRLDSDFDEKSMNDLTPKWVNCAWVQNKSLDPFWSQAIVLQ